MHIHDVMNRTYAFIVGIEEYDQPDWSLSGPCSNAVAMVEWLLSIDAIPQNLFVFLDPLDGEIARFTRDGVKVVSSASWTAIDTFWRETLPADRPPASRLLVFWSGHGFTNTDGSRVFVCRDYTANSLRSRVFDASNFLRHLRSTKYQCFTEQVFLADACGIYTGSDFGVGRDRPNDQITTKQIAFFATPEGTYARGDEDRGVFTNTVLTVLRQKKGWPDDHEIFADALDEALRNSDQQPFRVEVNTERRSYDFIAGSGRMAGPALVLERPAQRKHEIRSELDLLIPYQRTTEFVGRGAELESLRAWLRSEAPISVRVVTGGGGSGKTRIGVELIEWLAAAEPRQWNCGFLTREEMERFSGLENLSQWRRRKPVLAVVDYAAGSAERLQGWLEQLTAAAQGGEKLRLLLLEREANPDTGWLAAVIGRGFSAAAVRAVFDPPEPVRLEAVAEAAHRKCHGPRMSFGRSSAS